MTLRTKEPKPKVCKNCKCTFTPTRNLLAARVCSPMCGLSLARSKRAKAEKVAAVKERKADKVKLEKLKSKAQWAREAQKEFNAWIRLRDDDQPCISCGRHHQGQYHAGHYLSVGARPELRFEPLNVHKQCAPCNTYLSGNAVLYRGNLIEKIGLDAVEKLEGPCQKPTFRYSIDELKDLKTEYAQKTKALKGTV